MTSAVTGCDKCQALYCCCQGCRQVKKCGVDTQGERTERKLITGSGAELPTGPGAKPPEAENLLADRQHLSCDVCLEVRGEIITTVLFCIVY